MAVKTGEQPSAKHEFLPRILHALDLNPSQLAKAIGVKLRDIKPLMSAKHKNAGVDEDEVWWLINDYVSTRIGQLMAVKDQLNVQLQKDRARRIQRHEKFRDYHSRRKI